jgi:hypothetical protein
MIKNIFTLSILFLTIISSSIFCQSKKEQIRILQSKVDSLENLIIIQNNINSQKIYSLDSNVLILKENMEFLKKARDKIYNESKLKEDQNIYLSKQLELISEDNNRLKLELKKSDSITSLNIESQYNKICKIFDDWKRDMIKNDEYLPIEKCNLDYIQNSGDNNAWLSIPDEVHFLYGDLNNDNKIDALVWFAPIQCDGGNACMYCKEVLLIISRDNNYIVDKEYINNIERKNDLILFDYYSISENRIVGYYWKQNYENRFADFKGQFSINYSTRKVEFY